ncbi:diguanylate cyclase [Zobellella sp. DQSA1]|uniref:GGDEF domain-containing protein n=1 Tax=Zobellella sp. DQSA1 TaxID=3342386 RepID=UPI0035BEEAAA
MRYPLWDSLKWKLWCMALVAALCVMILASITFYQSVTSFLKAQQNAQDIRHFAAIFEAANLISAERGPANTYMAASIELREQARVRLDKLRTLADQRLDELESGGFPPTLLTDIHGRIEAARLQVDRVASRPQEQRTYDDIQAAIDAMFTAWDSYFGLIQWQAAELLRRDDSLTAPVLKAMMLSNLREYAGRLGSYLIAPMAAHEPVPLRNRIEGQVTRGRLLELWALLKPSSEALPMEARIRNKRQEAELRYFGEGLPLIDQLLDEDRDNQVYSLDPVVFTEYYVATMKPLEELRELLLNLTVREFELREEQALRALAMESLVTLLALLLVGGLVLALQLYLFGPLLRAADAVIALTDGGLGTPRPKPTDPGEIRRLFSAIAMLSERLRERERLTRELEQLALTDGLTSLLNRRAFDQLGERAAASNRRQDCPHLILIDIDHFKAINDGHGHPVGDQVLRDIAVLMSALLRQDDHLCRYGGEEFAVLIEGYSLPEAALLARRLRLAIRRHRVCIDPQGKTLSISASFGVAGGPGQSWEQIVRRTDEALYRAKAEGRDRVRIDRGPRQKPPPAGTPG